MEDTLMDIMYSVPSDETIETCTITKNVISEKAEPDYIRLDEKELKKKGAKKRFV